VYLTPQKCSVFYIYLYPGVDSFPCWSFLLHICGSLWLFVRLDLHRLVVGFFVFDASTLIVRMRHTAPVTESARDYFHPTRGQLNSTWPGHVLCHVTERSVLCSAFGSCGRLPTRLAGPLAVHSLYANPDSRRLDLLINLITLINLTCKGDWISSCIFNRFRNEAKQKVIN
jgi:hypothetical protein